MNRHLWDAYSVGKGMGQTCEREERNEEEAQMMTVSITEVAEMMSMEAMFLMRNFYT